MLRPTLDVTASLPPNGELTFRALVDTGAPISFADRGVGEALGVKFGQSGARRAKVRVLGGSYVAQIEAVSFSCPARPELSWNGDLALIDNYDLQMPFAGVLGHDGFLNKYAVTFNYYYNYFMVHSADDWHQENAVGLVAG